MQDNLYFIVVEIFLKNRSCCNYFLWTLKNNQGIIMRDFLMWLASVAFLQEATSYILFSGTLSFCTYMDVK